MSIDCRVAPIRGDQVVKIMFVVKPIPGSDNDVALNPLRSSGLRMGKLALSDAVRPVREVTDGCSAEVLDELVEHLFARLSGLDAPEPHFLGSIKLAQRVRYLARECTRGKLS